MESGRKPFFLIFVLAALLVVITLPYLLAASAGQPSYTFGGFLLNPIDGNSYLAKMYQGWQGSWTFRLPYSAEPGVGTYLFLFYLFLGHLARSAGLPLLLVYHLARLAGGVLLVLALDRFFRMIMPSRRAYHVALLLAVFGSGMGWLAAFFGGFTSDLWVAEAYPFLSAYANPHFPLGLALLVWLLTPFHAKSPNPVPPSEGKSDTASTFLPTFHERRRGWGIKGSLPSTSRRFLVETFLFALILGIVLPFGLVIALVALTGSLVLEFAFGGIQHGWQGISVNNSDWRRILVMFLGGTPVIIYDLWAANTDPALSVWNIQNLTLSPPAWDVLLSFSPVIWLAVLGALRIAKAPDSNGRILLGWAVPGMMLIFLPVGLQRRFMTGLYIPLAGLAVIGIEGYLSQPHLRYASALSRQTWTQNLRSQIIWMAIIILAVPTNFLVLTTAVHGIQTHDPAIYLTSGERMAFEWIGAQIPSESVILASPETGLYIPAWTGRRVVYGHPFETVDAKRNEILVRAYFQDPEPIELDPAFNAVDYVFYGPRERELGSVPDSLDLEVIYAAHGVAIYRVKR